MLTARVVRRKQHMNRKRFLWFGVYCSIVWIGVALVLVHRFFPSVLLLTPLPSLASTKPYENESEISHITQIKSHLLSHNMRIARSFTEENDTIHIELESGEILLFSKSKSLRSQISSLQFVTSRLTIENKRFSRLDLRFDKPVITLK